MVVILGGVGRHLVLRVKLGQLRVDVVDKLDGSAYKQSEFKPLQLPKRRRSPNLLVLSSSMSCTRLSPSPEVPLLPLEPEAVVWVP